MTNNSMENIIGLRPLSRKAAGFTLLEILFVLVTLGILVTLAIPAYNNYIDRAKVTLTVNTLKNAGKLFEDYSIDHQSYPLTVNFTTGEDGLGQKVFPSYFLSEFNKNIFAVVSYTATVNNYTLTATANDAKHTSFILTPTHVVQGP